MTDQPHAPNAETPAGQDEAAVDSLLGLKILVISLGVLLLVAAITFVVLLVRKLGEDDAAPVAQEISTTLAAGSTVPETTLVLAPGEEIVEMSLDGRSLALRVRSSTGERVLIVDPYTASHRAVIQVEQP